MELKDRFREARSAAGLTQEELAKRVGVSQNTIFKIENGVTKKPRDIVVFAKALGVTVDWLSEGNPPQSDEKPSKAGFYDDLSPSAKRLISVIRELDTTRSIPEGVSESITALLQKGFGKPIFKQNDQGLQELLNDRNPDPGTGK